MSRAVFATRHDSLTVRGASRGSDGWIIWNAQVHPILARARDELVEAGLRLRPREMRKLLTDRPALCSGQQLTPCAGERIIMEHREFAASAAFGRLRPRVEPDLSLAPR